MERLTTRVEDKVYYSKGKYPPTTLCAEMETHEIRECMKKLAEYEDTGLTPEEIESFKENYEMSRTGVQNLSAKLVKLDEERKYWRNEALKWASELGEQKIERGKQ